MGTLAQIAWNVDPVLWRAGPLDLRWYGLFFAAAFLGGHVLWSRRMARAGVRQGPVVAFLPLAFAAALVGARLGECLYRPGLCLDAAQLLRVREGGLSSHGAAAALLLALLLFSRWARVPVADALDRFAPSAALGAALVRLGNLMNGEVVGTPTALPWAFRFFRYDGGATARHPAQLYEAALAFAVLACLLLVDRRLGERRPRGLVAGLFLGLYFGGRILVETVKEAPRLAPGLPFTTGQALSLPFALAGMALVTSALRRGDRREA